jgi:hypothetical protein
MFVTSVTQNSAFPFSVESKSAEILLQCASSQVLDCSLMFAVFICHSEQQKYLP